MGTQSTWGIKKMKSQDLKINTSIRSLAIFILFLLANFQNCDIPVHCLKSQIAGEWTFYLTKAYEQSKKKLYKLGCSHSIPSNQDNAYKAKIGSKYFVKKIKIKLSEDDSAEFLQKELIQGLQSEAEYSGRQNSSTGKWTMVYDEGFDVNIDDYSFFAFSKYAPNPRANPFSGKKKEKFVSMCYSTLLGWFHKGDEWGCFFATKNNEKPNKITNGEVKDKLLVVEGTVKKQDNDFKLMRFKEQKKFDNKKHHNSTVDYINSVQNLWTAEAYDEFSHMTIQELNKYAGRKREFPKEAKSIADKFFTKNPMKISPIQTQQKPQHYNLTDYNYIQQNLKFAKLLKNKAKTFKTNNKKKLSKNKNTEFNKAIKKLNKNDFARNIKFKSIFSTTILRRKKSKSKSRKMSRKNKDSDFKDLPKNFKRWVDYMPPVRNQGKCGSCYAVSTLSMLEARLKIKMGISEEFSLDHILNCSVYNQGCEGGYSYLVLKFAKELELIPKKCEKRKNNKFQCGSKKCKSSHKNKFSSYKVKKFGYLGGSYGKCSEELLMRELQKNGPVVVSFEPDYHFMMYRKGIYKSLKSNWFNKNLQKPEWQKVDHSVTLVGWGFDEIHQKKYWLLLNSWGKHWGENGYFRMMRGEDHNGIESICETGEIEPNVI